jgi:hypothetical protein
MTQAAVEICFFADISEPTCPPASPPTPRPLFRRHLKVHSYYGGLGGLQLPLMRVRATRQHGNRRGRPAGSGFGLQEDLKRFETENGL